MPGFAPKAPRLVSPGPDRSAALGWVLYAQVYNSTFWIRPCERREGVGKARHWLAPTALVAQKLGHRFNSRADVELLVNVSKMSFDRRNGDTEGFCHFLGPIAFGNQAENLLLTSR